jgi:hypothetical protein
MDLILHNYIEQKGHYSQMRGPLMIGGIMQTRQLLVRSEKGLILFFLEYARQLRIFVLIGEAKTQKT